MSQMTALSPVAGSRGSAFLPGGFSVFVVYPVIPPQLQDTLLLKGFTRAGESGASLCDICDHLCHRCFNVSACFAVSAGFAVSALNPLCGLYNRSIMPRDEKDACSRDPRDDAASPARRRG